MEASRPLEAHRQVPTSTFSVGQSAPRNADLSNNVVVNMLYLLLLVFGTIYLRTRLRTQLN